MHTKDHVSWSSQIYILKHLDILEHIGRMLNKYKTFYHILDISMNFTHFILIQVILAMPKCYFLGL